MSPFYQADNNTTVFQDLMTQILGWFGGLDTEVADSIDNEKETPSDSDQGGASNAR